MPKFRVLLTTILFCVLSAANAQHAKSFNCKCVLEPGRGNRANYQVVRFEKTANAKEGTIYVGAVWDNRKTSKIKLKETPHTGQRQWARDEHGRLWLLEILEPVYAK